MSSDLDRSLGWLVQVTETSAGAYLVEGRDGADRSICLRGEDPDTLLYSARRWLASVATSDLSARHCDETAGSWDGRRARSTPMAADLVEVMYDRSSWSTLFRCRVCGAFWEEGFRETGHGEVPYVERVSSSGTEET